jgi:adenosylmethionine-8-amino-7-oxononanoate aminotransferase
VEDDRTSLEEAAMPRQTLWHPFADMAKVVGRELVLLDADGAWVTDEDDRRYLDASAGLWFCNVGHGREALAQAAADQMRRIAGYQIFDVVANRPALELAERLCRLAPLGEGSAAFFTNGGSDAIDTAAKMVRRYWTATGHPERQIIVARAGAYHGMNAYGTSLAGIEANAQGWGPLIPEVLHVERNDTEELERVLRANAGRVAAFIGEPVQGAAGVHPPAEGYWDRVQALCSEHDVLLIADEVITGFGRLGEWFGCERFGIRPDLLVGAKGVTSGYAPLGVVIAGDRVRSALWAEGAGVFRHGYTYSGHPTACAVALANLDVLEQEGLVDRVRELEPVLAREIGGLESHRLVAEVRAIGLLAGVELAPEALAEDPLLVEKVVVAARERGVLVRNLLGSCLQISPPFVITAEEIAMLATVLGEALDAVGATVPASPAGAPRSA